MFNRREKPAARIDTLIGRTANVLGDIEFAGGLHVDGRITGNVRVAAGATASLSVSEHGTIEGSVEATHVVVNGSVNGDIHATERVILGARARVRGNVSYGIIEMAMGAEISGKLMPIGTAAAGSGGDGPGGSVVGAAAPGQPGPSEP
jgi:cytoskeletal protein CcmA (bactofilin family)